MGVKDLWQLLSPIGRRISIETLEGKTLAIDASVWIIQFIKALRDENGNMQKNAHIIGTIRRILKLLYHKIKPLFVFDGATPPLKIKTVQARRDRQQGYERDQKLVAQRILISQIKQNVIKAKLDKDKSIKDVINDGKYSSTFNMLPSISESTSQATTTSQQPVSAELNNNNSSDGKGNGIEADDDDAALYENNSEHSDDEDEDEELKLSCK